jgi:sacsin
MVAHLGVSFNNLNLCNGLLTRITSPQRKVLPRNQINGRCMAGVKIKLSRLRIACEDQLVPFEGLWGYTQSLNNYRGTIFRFPLRTTATSSGSALRNSKRVVDESEVCKLMKTYFHEGRTSLLFLRRIKSIDFGIQSQPDFEWSITRLLHVDEDVDLFSKSVVCQITWKSIFGTQLTGKDKWWVAIEDLLPEADRLPDSSRREMKNVECGIAALISSKFDSLSSPAVGPEASPPRMFSTLPLPTYSDLPVHIHATFWLSGDRQSIAIDDVKSQGVGWNRYLLQEALPNLYLSFLDDILPQVRQRVFSFWPQEEPPKRSCAELLCASFWQKLPRTSQRLFPKAQPAVGAPQRRPPESLDISRAVFDFLSSSQSKTLAPLLMAMQVNLVRDIPIKITKHLKAVPEVKCVTGPMLRTLFKSENGRTNLLKEVAQNPNILEVLFDLLIPVDAELHHLDGCHVLPLADGTLATLRLKNSIGAESPKYFVVSEDELKLFGFASRHLVKSSIGTMLEPVLESGKFNLARLKLRDVKKLLEMKPTVSTRSAEEDRWLTEFWKYWNSNIDSSVPSSNIDTLDAKIFGRTRSGLNSTHLYASPRVFHTVPAVVEPSSGEHKKLCDRFPDLWRFKPDLMPKSMADEEKSFYHEASFYRLIRSLRLLSGRSGIGMFVKTHLDAANLKVRTPFKALRIPSYSEMSHESSYIPKCLAQG